MMVETKEEVYKIRVREEEKLRSQKKDLRKLEDRLAQRESIIDKKSMKLDRRESIASKKEKEVNYLKVELEKNLQEQRKKLESIADLSSADAKALLMKRLEEEARFDSAKKIREIEENASEIAERKAKEIISTAIQRYAHDYVAEATVSVVDLPNDEMKGRIIGREGRNIRAFEKLTGVNLIVDDTPEAVILSCFNPVRREKARIALEELVIDGRIHPAKIEEKFDKANRIVDNQIKIAGEKAVFNVGIAGLNKDLIRVLGRLKYRTSFGQNVLQHSIEVAHLAGIMASELGVNVKKAKRAGLLHDIGKAIDHEVEGSHASIGADLAKKYNESRDIVHAIHAHHEEIQAQNILDVIVSAADAVSSARPGIRQETLESYIKRLESLESIGKEFDGVEKCYAIQAGREIRVMVYPDMVDDDQAARIARELSKKIEEELEYPGQIKVTVIREKRAIEYAK
jgi:ribonuclease Y